MNSSSHSLLSESNSNIISLIRLLATISIVACHILQSLDNNYAWVFNIGVQIFFVISGLLYGYKDIENRTFYKNRVRKIYFPYIIFTIVIIMLDILLLDYDINPVQLFIYMFGIQGLPYISGLSIPGLGHLWFITAILLCYLITPVIQYIRNVWGG